MLDLSSVLTFSIASLALLLVPGPAVLYIVARGIDQGRRAGIISTLGIGAGTVFHIAAATLGLSALLNSSAMAFSVVKYLGAAYLVYLGIRKLLEKGEGLPIKASSARGMGRVFYQGLLVNLLNPKTALFFLAFLPQFVDPQKGSVQAQIFFLGILFAGLGLACDTLFALLAGSLGNWLRSNSSFLRTQRYFAASVYLSLGLATALSGSDARKTA